MAAFLIEKQTRVSLQVSAGSGAEVEAFVHGALCVSYSGQCYSSEAWGGRSANRGQCAQVRGGDSASARGALPAACSSVLPP